MKLNEFLEYFNSVKCIGKKQYMVRCPYHNDKKASLSITERDNKILMHCFAGCNNKQILKRKGLDYKDLFNDERRK